MVSGRGLSPGLLGGRGPAESLLPRRHPAKASKAQEELSGANQERIRNRLSSGAPQPVVYRGAETGFGHRSHGDARLFGGVRLVKQVEQARGGLDQVPGGTEAYVAVHVAEPNQKLVRLR